MTRPKIVKCISEAIHSLEPTATSILFGSEARGDARENSDIDVLVLLDADNDFVEREGNVTYELFQLGLKNGVEINPVVFRRSHWENRPFKTPFYCNVMNEGVLI